MELIKGLPYSAVKKIEGVRTTPDGKRLPYIQPPFRICRDSAGRMRKEVMLIPGARDNSTSPAVEIDDPVEGARYALDAASGIAHRIRVVVRPPLDSTVERASARLVPGPKQPRIQTVKLGAKEIAGIKAEGVRTVVTWPAGAVGNAKPRVITSEKWLDPGLNLVVLWRSSDPESSINESLAEIDRKEPDPSLFKVPSNYKIIDDEPPQLERRAREAAPRMQNSTPPN